MVVIVGATVEIGERSNSTSNTPPPTRAAELLDWVRAKTIKANVAARAMGCRKPPSIALSSRGSPSRGVGNAYPPFCTKGALVRIGSVWGHRGLFPKSYAKACRIDLLPFERVRQLS